MSGKYIICLWEVQTSLFFLPNTYRLIYEGWDSEFVEIAVLSPYTEDLVTKQVLGYDSDCATVDVNTLVDIINTVNEYVEEEV